MRRFPLFNRKVLIVLIAILGPAQVRAAPPRERRPASPASAPVASPATEATSSPAAEPASSAAGFSKHLERGLALYDQAAYSNALREFEAAYEIQQLPRLLYNLARAHIQLGHAEAALGLYQKFLRIDPGAPDEIKRQAREDMTRAGAMIEAAERIRAIKDRQPVAPEPAPSLPAVSHTGPRDKEVLPAYKRWWFWPAISGGVALFGGAIAGGILGYRASHPPLPLEQVPAGTAVFTISL